MYTLVPDQVREDMEWIADTGTDAVTIAVLEQDLYAARENIETIHREAARVGLKLFAAPSRWAGQVAGAPRVPGLFTASHPETWVRNEDGTPYLSSYSGPMPSLSSGTRQTSNDRESNRHMIRNFAGITASFANPLTEQSHETPR